jgi:hypothetical protein
MYKKKKGCGKGIGGTTAVIMKLRKKASTYGERSVIIIGMGDIKVGWVRKKSY